MYSIDITCTFEKMSTILHNLANAAAIGPARIAWVMADNSLFKIASNSMSLLRKSNGRDRFLYD